VAEEPDLYDASEHLYLCEKLIDIKSANLCRRYERNVYIVVLGQLLLGEGCVDDKIAVVRNDRPGFCLRHSERGAWCAKTMEVLQEFGVRERRDFDWHALRVLRGNYIRLNTVKR